ncbi:MAG: hypothetical protein KAT91_01700 [Candidatus Aenigmarchaeota archaeon]|nr:hypothetical protein [Candidatus Aenigmarchaeota archaeon]
MAKGMETAIQIVMVIVVLVVLAAIVTTVASSKITDGGEQMGRSIDTSGDKLQTLTEKTPTYTPSISYSSSSESSETDADILESIIDMITPEDLPDL